jgi:hypothetical protein
MMTPEQRIDTGLQLIGRYDLRGMEEWLARQGLGSPESMEPPAWERMTLSITAECRRLLSGVLAERDALREHFAACEAMFEARDALNAGHTDSFRGRELRARIAAARDAVLGAALTPTPEPSHD